MNDAWSYNEARVPAWQRDVREQCRECNRPMVFSFSHIRLKGRKRLAVYTDKHYHEITKENQDER